MHKNPDISATEIPDIDLHMSITFITYFNSRPRDVFKPAIFHKKLLPIVLINKYYGWNIFYTHPYNSKPGFMSFYGGLTLTFKIGIDHHELPAGGCFCSVNPIITTCLLYTSDAADEEDSVD